MKLKNFQCQLKIRKNAADYTMSRVTSYSTGNSSVVLYLEIKYDAVLYIFRE
jgi:hypothetical protein